MQLEIHSGDSAWKYAEPLFAEVWPKHVMAEKVWCDVLFAHAERRILVWDGDTLASHVGLYRRDGTWNGDKVRMAGIGGVATRPDRRKRGAASAAMRRAAIEMEVEAIDFGLLFCEPHNFGFYRSLGWQRFSGPVLFEQPKAEGRMQMSGMSPFVLDLKLAPREGAIDLCGLPW